MEDKIIEWAEKFEKIVAEKMPDAIDLGLNYVRIDALANILFGLMMASIAFFPIGISEKSYSITDTMTLKKV